MTQTRQKTTLVNNHSEGGRGSIFLIEVKTLLAGLQSEAWFQPKPLAGAGGLKLSAGDQNSMEF